MNFCFLIELVQIKDRLLVTLWFKTRAVESMDKMQLVVLLETSHVWSQKLRRKMINFLKTH